MRQIEVTECTTAMCCVHVNLDETIESLKCFLLMRNKIQVNFDVHKLM
jgi:hypothetical protein